MKNASRERTPIRTRDAAERSRSFQEVTLGYSEEDAVREAERCLHCKKPLCVDGCPVRIRIPDFIAAVAAGDFAGAYRILSESTMLPAVCGRVCPQENQCEGKCVRGIRGEPVAIGRLERFVADWYRAHVPAGEAVIPSPDAKKVAVVGSGPAGLSCAGELAKRGYAVTIFEALHTPGGVLVYGIPEFRLPKSIVSDEITGLIRAGVTVETDTVVGRTVTVDELMEEGFSAVFLATGAGLPRFMGIPGESANGVYSANEYLTRINLMGAYRPDSDTPVMHAGRVIVVGGGNVAMDAARCARRLGAEVAVVYRRGMEELPARHEEVIHAQEEGIVFHVLTNPVEILEYRNPDCARDPRNGSVRAVRCVRMSLGEPDASGRRRPVAVPGSEFEMEADCVIMALGTTPNPLIRQTTPGLETQTWGGIVTDADGATSRPGIFAGGDAVTGAATVILAMGAGKNAAAAIDTYLREKRP